MVHSWSSDYVVIIDKSCWRKKSFISCDFSHHLGCSLKYNYEILCFGVERMTYFKDLFCRQRYFHVHDDHWAEVLLRVKRPVEFRSLSTSLLYLFVDFYLAYQYCLNFKFLGGLPWKCRYYKEPVSLCCLDHKWSAYCPCLHMPPYYH